MASASAGHFCRGSHIGTVTWTNPSGVLHTTTSNSGVWSGDLFPGDTFTFTFMSPGVYNYHCVFHVSLGMSGTITVLDTGGSPTVTPTPEPTATPIVSLCPLKSQGDANCDGRITLTDFTIWKNQFLGNDTGLTADFNGDGRITITDFTIWRNSFLAS